MILVEFGMFEVILVVVLLYDIVEDIDYIFDWLWVDFGDEIVMLVDGVIKFDKVIYGEVV